MGEWADISDSNHLFNLRDKNYLNDKKKTDKNNHVFFKFLKCKTYHDKSNKNIIFASDINDDVYKNLTSSRDEIFIINIKYLKYNTIMYFSANKDDLKKDDHFYRFYQKIMNKKDLKDRFKLLPHFNNSVLGFLTRLTCRPALLGRKITTKIKYNNNITELSFDANVSRFAMIIIRLVISNVSFASFELGYTLEARDFEELPEKIFAKVSINNINFKNSIEI